MKLTSGLLACALLAGYSPSFAAPAEASAPQLLGAQKGVSLFTNIQIMNFDDEKLGRITDLGIDLVNGRIVEVLIDCDASLGLGKKIIAVPPLAFFPDLLNEVYRLNVDVETFKSAAGIELSKWVESGRSDRVAAAYKLFGEEPYFLAEGETASKTAARPKVPLGYVERSSKILDLPVGNFQGDKFGKVWSMTLDIPQGRIRSVIILAPGNFKTKSIVPAMALSFNAKRDALLLDSTKQEFADEPRYVMTEAAFGQDAYAERESYTGARTSVALEQGRKYIDLDRTLRIRRDIRAAKINARHVEVGTMNTRVTLRGWVNTEGDKLLIHNIAVAAAANRPEIVDNQITVGAPVGSR